jgi:L-aspartate semialdehyde sulfurtransferase ferredoxin
LSFIRKITVKEKHRYWFTFDSKASNQPLICLMGRQFDIVFNIRNANVTKELGIIAMELEGERSVLKSAVQWMESQGVQVEPVEINTIEG